MAYIYGKEPEDPKFDEDEEVQCQKCKRGVNLYYEAIFVIAIYVNDEKIPEQERWCRQCAVKGMKGDFSG
jgi:hypothetical protein